jgi:hypothetical protein
MRNPDLPKHLSDQERLDRLRLIRSDNVGPRGIMAQTPQAFRRSTVHLKGVDYARVTRVGFGRDYPSLLGCRSLPSTTYLRYLGGSSRVL